MTNDIEMPKLTVRAQTLDEEVNYVWNRIHKIDFYNRFGYNLSLPDTEEMKSIINRSIAKSLEDTDIGVLRVELSKVYRNETYQNGINAITEAVGITKKTFKVFEKYAIQWGFKLHSEYTIKLTQYGPGGSYDSDTGDVIIKTVKTGIASKRKQPAEIMVHEITHIGIENIIIEKYDLSHEVKERIVDKFISHHFQELFPNYGMWSKGDTRIDQYLDHDDSWDRLPYYVEMFANEN